MIETINKTQLQFIASRLTPPTLFWSVGVVPQGAHAWSGQAALARARFFEGLLVGVVRDHLGILLGQCFSFARRAPSWRILVHMRRVSATVVQWGIGYIYIYIYIYIRKILETLNIWENIGNWENSGKSKKPEAYELIWETGKISEHAGNLESSGQYGNQRTLRKYREICVTWKTWETYGEIRGTRKICHKT